MVKGGSRPAAGRPPRSRRPGRAGVGPGPAYRPSSSGGGKPCGGSKSSSTARGPVAGLVFGIALFAVLFVGTPITYLVYEYAKTR